MTTTRRIAATILLAAMIVTGTAGAANARGMLNPCQYDSYCPPPPPPR